MKKLGFLKLLFLTRTIQKTFSGILSGTLPGVITALLPLSLIFSPLACNSDIVYYVEPLKAPLALYALEQEDYRTPANANYTLLQFFAYNNSYDFDGYAISAGADEAAALSATPELCLLQTNNVSTGSVTKIQLGGDLEYSGMKCSLLTFAQPTAAGNWIAIRAYSSRDCSQYTQGECNNYSQAVTAQVQQFVRPPGRFTINSQTDDNDDEYFFLEIDLTAANTNALATGEAVLGAAIFIGESRGEMEAAANNDIDSAAAICTNSGFTDADTVEIQINGELQTASGDNAFCYLTLPHFASDYKVLVRTYVDRPQYPWSAAYILRTAP